MFFLKCFFRYGDFVPTTVASKALMTLWILVGLVTMGVVTGVISSGMTVGDMEEELMLYGTLVCDFLPNILSLSSASFNLHKLKTKHLTYFYLL